MYVMYAPRRSAMVVMYAMYAMVVMYVMYAMVVMYVMQ